MIVKRVYILRYFLYSVSIAHLSSAAYLPKIISFCRSYILRNNAICPIGYTTDEKLMPFFGKISDCDISEINFKVQRKDAFLRILVYLRNFASRGILSTVP